MHGFHGGPPAFGGCDQGRHRRRSLGDGSRVTTIIERILAGVKPLAERYRSRVHSLERGLSVARGAMSIDALTQVRSAGHRL